jgi:hypothetical protein
LAAALLASDPSTAIIIFLNICWDMAIVNALQL